jgi:hypothetical protein
MLASGVNPMAERKAEAEAKQQEVKSLEREAESSFEDCPKLVGVVGDRQIA